jgi:hypothetical protein
LKPLSNLQKNILLKAAVTNHILVVCKMRKFLKELWDCWQTVQQERAEWFAKHGSAWE